jgi:hypothetical protein
VGVSAAVSFSLALILCHELDGDSSPLHHFITIAPCFKKNGQNQASGTSLLCLLEPLF